MECAVVMFSTAAKAGCIHDYNTVCDISAVLVLCSVVTLSWKKFCSVM